MMTANVIGGVERWDWIGRPPFRISLYSNFDPKRIELWTTLAFALGFAVDSKGRQRHLYCTAPLLPVTQMLLREKCHANRATCVTMPLHCALLIESPLRLSCTEICCWNGWKMACVKHKSGGHQLGSTTNKRTVDTRQYPPFFLSSSYMNDTRMRMSGYRWKDERGDARY
jgi:hypothetical protein